MSIPVGSVTERVEIGDAVLYHGDCLEILPTLPKVDAVVTDPPYGEVNRDSSGLRNMDKGAADAVSGGEIEGLCAIGAETFYVFCGVSQVSEIRDRLAERGYTVRLGGWEKSNPSPMNGDRLWLSGFEACVFARRKGAVFSEFCKTAIWRGPTRGETEHPTEKPVWLMGRLVQASTAGGHSVLDPFMGSGTTGVACANLGRKFIGIEIERKYFDIAVERITQAYAQRRLFA